MRPPIAFLVILHTGPALPIGVEKLVQSAWAEGYKFPRRLEVEWATGKKERFDRPGEGLFLAHVEGAIVGMSGICRDPYQTDINVGRLRHVYVEEAYRKQGLARRLVETCLNHTGHHFKEIRLSTTNPVAAQLYESLGFEPLTIEGQRLTHRLDLGCSS